MTTLPPLIDANRALLRDSLATASPPAHLRERVLRTYAIRRTGKRAAPFILIAFAALLVSQPGSSPDDAVRQWQARSSQVEATWRADGDREWLLSDARAQPLLYRLRRVDEAIARFDADTSPDARPLARLWRERTETLTALVDSRRQGGVAVQL